MSTAFFHYAKRLGSAFRLISPTEAEEADKEVVGEVFRMVYHDGVSFENALDSVVREDLLVRYHMAVAAHGLPAQKQVLANIALLILLLGKVPRWYPFFPFHSNYRWWWPPVYSMLGSASGTCR